MTSELNADYKDPNVIRILGWADTTEYIVKSYRSIIHGPCTYAEAKETALQLREQYQSDEYRIEEYNPTERSWPFK